MTSFAEIQSQLPKALDANRPGSSDPHVVVDLPSLSVAESLLAHYVFRGRTAFIEPWNVTQHEVELAGRDQVQPTGGNRSRDQDRRQRSRGR